MKRLEHPFFDAIDEINKTKSWNVFEGKPFPQREFFQALKQATPIIYDKQCTEEAMFEGGDEIVSAARVDIEGMEEKTREKANLVEEFTLPHATSLYLLTKCPTILRKSKDKDVFVYKRVGYLIKETSQEKLLVFDLMLVSLELDGKKKEVFIPDWYEIDLEKFGYDETMNNLASDIVAINRLTEMISVKRVGVSAGRTRTVKTKGFGIGYTTIKTERLIYIADKVEYEYIESDPDPIHWYDYNGHWRGHWRAFYKYDGDRKMKDSRGRDLVDYSRIGKNRSGEYIVPGYTWVVEHTKGNPLYAEIKTKFVSAG